MPETILFTCKHCGVTFKRIIYPSHKHPDYCSPSCRNKARTKRRDDLCICPQCNLFFTPKNRYQPSTFCSRSCAGQSNKGKRKVFTSTMHQEIVATYALRGAAELAEHFGISIDTVHTIAYRYGCKLEDDIYRRLVHDAAQKHMLAHNPMRNPKSKRKMLMSLHSRPSWPLHLQKLQEGQRRVAKDKPSKPELRTKEILADLGVSFEHQAKIGNKFFVDFLIGKTIIQVDGEYWHGHPRFEPFTKRQLAQQRRDRSHDAYCQACGYTVHRIWAEEITSAAIKALLP